MEMHCTSRKPLECVANYCLKKDSSIIQIDDISFKCDECIFLCEVGHPVSIAYILTITVVLSSKNQVFLLINIFVLKKVTGT